MAMCAQRMGVLFSQIHEYRSTNVRLYYHYVLDDSSGTISLVLEELPGCRKKSASKSEVQV